jgi:hypothetical protein
LIPYLPVLIDVFVEIGLEVLPGRNALESVLLVSGLLQTFFFPFLENQVLKEQLFPKILIARVVLQSLLNQQLELHLIIAKESNITLHLL